MRHLWRNRSGRMATAVMSLFAVVMLFTLSPMSSVANSFIDRFRVQKFEAITVDMAEFQKFGMQTMFDVATSDQENLESVLTNLGDYSTSFDEENPWANAQEFDSIEDAQAAYGDFDIAENVPDAYANSQILASDSGSITINVNTAEAQALVEELGLPIFSLPDADASPVMTFTVDVPSGIVQRFTGPDPESNIVVAEMPSPTLTTPTSVDMDNLREDLLTIPGLPPDFVAQLRAIQDWEETLVIPVPEGVASDDVTINGEPGLSFVADDESGSAVLWQKDGTLHVVGGTESLDVIRDIADSLN